MDNLENENYSAIGLRSIVVGTSTQSIGENKMSGDEKK